MRRTVLRLFAGMAICWTVLRILKTADGPINRLGSEYGNQYCNFGPSRTGSQYSLLRYCACAQLKASKRGSHFIDTNLQFINLFVELHYL